MHRWHSASWLFQSVNSQCNTYTVTRSTKKLTRFWSFFAGHTSPPCYMLYNKKSQKKMTVAYLAGCRPIHNSLLMSQKNHYRISIIMVRNPTFISSATSVCSKSLDQLQCMVYYVIIITRAHSFPQAAEFREAAKFALCRGILTVPRNLRNDRWLVRSLTRQLVWFLVIHIFFHHTGNTSVVQLKHLGSEWQTC